MKVHQRKVRVQGGTNSSLTELQSFPLDGLVAGREENFPFSCWAVAEKAMAPPFQYSCLENPMDGGAW